MTTSSQLGHLRDKIRFHELCNEASVIQEQVTYLGFSDDAKATIQSATEEHIKTIRASAKPSIMTQFLGKYGLSTEEGVALMSLAEALQRIPDSKTKEVLIQEKVGPYAWSDHYDNDDTWLVKSATGALTLAKRLLPDIPTEQQATLNHLFSRFSRPTIRSAVSMAMRVLGSQFIFGRTIAEGLRAAGKSSKTAHSYSFDMLGEAAVTKQDALEYFAAYRSAILAITEQYPSADPVNAPGISVKLSALHPRYETAQRERVLAEMVPQVLELALLARKANIGFNIDAEEAGRLDLSLDIVEQVLRNESLADWGGFGMVIQAYGPRSIHVIEWFNALAGECQRQVTVRLVKGAYWDAEIKLAQEKGLGGLPVFRNKHHTDIMYMACAKKLFASANIYPQFATHNVQTMHTILHLSKGQGAFEFQRLHGMGEEAYLSLLQNHNVRCRVYAPIGQHESLLAYLVRRLLENGANSSFVNQLMNKSVALHEISANPLDKAGVDAHPTMDLSPASLFGADRQNSKGWDWESPATLETVMRRRDAYKTHIWHCKPMIDGPVVADQSSKQMNPARPEDLVGLVTNADAADIETAIVAAQTGFQTWSTTSIAERKQMLLRVADLLEQNSIEFFALLAREAGKTLTDAIGEVREAVDFARYYANQCGRDDRAHVGTGIMTCISPWNFPLAIFSGQVLGALAAGNAVLAKPAGQTALIAAFAVKLFHLAGIPKNAIQLLPGSGATVGQALVSDARIGGVCFTGSTATAQHINKAMAQSMSPVAPLIAETGGLNAMIVDSTALLEQVTTDIIRSAFQSAGQRCSALRMLYVQEDIADELQTMLIHAMQELNVDDPWKLSTDIGPVIDQPAKRGIVAHCQAYERKHKVLKTLPVATNSLFVSPTLISVAGIEELEEEIFGPVLHIATYKEADFGKVIQTINDAGYGLTFGIHSRLKTRVDYAAKHIHAGNVYVNRNQIGAIVGSQPFGGHGLSGTGPKAGGPHYVSRMTAAELHSQSSESSTTLSAEIVQQALTDLNTQSALYATDLPPMTMPGPTGETNELSFEARGTVLCLGPTATAAKAQAEASLAQGNKVLVVTPEAKSLMIDTASDDNRLSVLEGLVSAEALETLQGFDAVLSAAELGTLREYRVALAQRVGVLIPLIHDYHSPERLVLEKHVCTDTTAAGGNASLLMALS